MIKNIIFLFAVLLIVSNCFAVFECDSNSCPQDAYPIAFQVNISGLQQYPCDTSGLDCLECVDGNCVEGCYSEDAGNPGALVCRTGGGGYDGECEDGFISLSLSCVDGEPVVSIYAGGEYCGNSSSWFGGVGEGLEGSASNNRDSVCDGGIWNCRQLDKWGGSASYTPIWNCSRCDACGEDPDITVIPEEPSTKYPTEKCCGSSGGSTYRVSISCENVDYVMNLKSSGGAGCIEKVTKIPEDCSSGGTATFIIETKKADMCTNQSLSLDADFYNSTTQEYHHGSATVELVPACGSCCDKDCLECFKKAGGA